MSRQKPIETCTPRLPKFIHDAVLQHAKDHGCKVIHSYETLITLGLQRSISFEEVLDGNKSHKK